MRKLILTVLHQYHYPVVEPFIKSLKSCGYDGDLVIFVSKTTSKSTQKLLRKHGATLISYNTQFPFIDGYEGIFEHISPSVTINNYRFLFYLQYLARHPGKFDGIMLTDIRDVIFQSDPFKRINTNEISFFLEDESEIFRTSKLNYNWCVMANGLELTHQIIDQNVSCAGITMGGYLPILDYLKYLQSRLVNRPDLNWGLDQGLHNAYLYVVKPPNAVLVPNTAPFTLTLGACSSFTQNENGLVCNDQLEPYRLVHQWDRLGDLMVYFKRKYVGMRAIQIVKKMLFKFLP